MTEWTTEARDYMEGYLRQVEAHARHQGDDAGEITEELRTHVAREAEEAAGTMVTLEQVRRVTAALGTPEQVTGSEGAVPAPITATPPAPPTPPAQVIVEQKKSRTGCWIFAAVALVVGVVAIPIVLILAAIAVPSIQRAKEAEKRSACAGNLKELGSVLQRYASDHNGLYPPLSPESGRFMFTAKDMMAYGAMHPKILVCPADFDAPKGVPTESDYFDDESYYYLSHSILNDAQAEVFPAAYRAARANKRDMNLHLEGNDGTVFPRLEAFESDAIFEETFGAKSSEIPILVERPNNHQPPGGNVLYLDGHVEFIKHNDKFPMTDTFFAAMTRAEH